jgi:uncharacterized protein (TIGR02246 family)
MKPNRLSWIALVLFLIPGLATAADTADTAEPASPVSPVETEIRAADAKRMDAMVRGDVQALATLLAPDVTYTHSTGEVQTREIFLETISSGRLDYVSMIPSDVKVRVLGDRAAVITGLADVKLIAQGKENTVALRFTSVWTRSGDRDGGWQMVVWQSTRLP